MEVTDQILAAVDRWLEREVAPHAAKLEHEDVWPAAMVEGMKKLGLFGATISPEHGGLGLSAGVYSLIVSRISEVWMSLTGIFNSHLMMALLVEKYGSSFLKGKYLPRFATGEIRGGLALTEPNAGTDLQAIRLRARREGDSYVLNGTKTWISNGIQGSCFAVLAKTDPDAQPRHKGMAMLLCEKGPGFGASRKLEKLGYKGIDSAELVFQDYRVPAANLIGEDGRGFHQAVGGLERQVSARLHPADLPAQDGRTRKDEPDVVGLVKKLRGEAQGPRRGRGRLIRPARQGSPLPEQAGPEPTGPHPLLPSFPHSRC